MNPIEIIILALIVISAFLLSIIYIAHQRKTETQDGYTYWFENVDEIM